MGFEGYMAYDISELTSSNPWDASIPLETLPVFRNKLTVNEDYLLRGGDFDRMEEVLKDVAERLGLDSESLTSLMMHRPRKNVRSQSKDSN